MAPVYLRTASGPTLTAARLMVLVPVTVRVPQFTIGTRGLLAVVGVNARVAPKPEAAPFIVRLPMVSVPLPTWLTPRMPPLATVVGPVTILGVLNCRAPALTQT